jgi:hypothetical protein
MRVWVRTVATRLLATLAAVVAVVPDARADAPPARVSELPGPPAAGVTKATPATAKTLAGCSGWLGRARTLREEQRLLDARDALAHCNEARCEDSVQKECSLAQKELEQRIPQLVLRVKTVDGGHIDQARAYIDGRPALPDTVIELDPGQHSIRTHHDDYIGRETRVTLASGERQTLVVELRERAPVIDDGGARARFSRPPSSWTLTRPSVSRTSSGARPIATRISWPWSSGTFSYRGSRQASACFRSPRRPGWRWPSAEATRRSTKPATRRYSESREAVGGRRPR